MSSRTRILVVDEEPMIARLVAETLDAEQYEVHSARSDAEAAERLTEPFDVLLLHRRLPDSSCEDLVRAARQHREPVILLLSSEKSLEVERNMLRLGAAEILYKPLDPLEVRACIERNKTPARIPLDVPGGPRVLVVDDDELVLRSVRDILRDGDFTVEATRSPYRALELLREQAFEILLSDLMMDELSGIDLIRAALNNRPALQAIVMTGYASKDTAVAALKEGVYDFLEKPLMPDIVRQTVSRAWKALRYQLENRRLLAALRDQLDEKKNLLADLEAKTADLERFTYTVSHDLKSPIVTIQGFLGFLKRDLESGDKVRIEHDMGRISAAARSMHRLLDELLELSRIGRMDNPPEQAELGDLAREAVEKVGDLLHKRGVEVEIAPGLPIVRGDRPRLQEVLLNLIENAAKFMGEQASPRIEVGLRSDDTEQVFYVRDNGIGIPPEYHEKIFGLFEQLDLDAAGTGIGLALTRRIVDVHGGRIWVESDGPGLGSTFLFTLSDMSPDEGGAQPGSTAR